MKRSKLALVTFILAFMPGCATHMQRALDDLRDARRQLEEAADNKGGHRVKAIELTDAAIAETERGMEFAATH
jgi:hypothetical protein